MAENIETMDEEAIDELKSMYNSSEPSGLMSKLKDTLNRWKSKPLNIAIIGNSGTGKSTYINALRNMEEGDEGFAAVGETETTVGDPISYKNPRNSYLLYWDLPGVGTSRYPKGTYLSQVGFEKFDFYILISSQRFTENDLWLAKEIEKAGKKFCFLRSKIDNALTNEKRAHRNTYDKEATLAKIRKNCVDELSKAGIQTIDVFLISSYEPALFDFCPAQERLLNDFPNLKKDALILSVSYGQSNAILKEKTEVMRLRIWKVSLMSCMGTVIPIPGYSYLLDIKIIQIEADSFARQLSLDDSSVENLARLAGVPESSLKNKRHLYSGGETITKLQERKGVVRTVLSFVPFVGTIVNLDAFVAVRNILTDILNEYEQAALDILESTQTLIAKKAAEELDI